MSQQFARVWYATPEKIGSMTKLIVFDDRGPLDVRPDEIQFRGKETKVTMRKVVAASLTSQRIPWVSYVIVNVAVVAYFAIKYGDELNLGLMAGLLAVTNLLGLLVAASTKWVMVEYQDESNQTRRAFFADGSALGWGGALGGTRALYRAVKQNSHVGE